MYFPVLRVVFILEIFEHGGNRLFIGRDEVDGVVGQHFPHYFQPLHKYNVILHQLSCRKEA
jgi:hypothetical protein